MMLKNVIILHVAVWFFQPHLLKILPFLSCISLPNFHRLTDQELPGFISGFSILSPWAVCVCVPAPVCCHPVVSGSSEPPGLYLPGSSVRGVPRQEYWSGLPLPSPGDLPDPGIEPISPARQMDSLPLSHLRSPRLQPCSIVWSQGVWFLQLHFAFLVKQDCVKGCLQVTVDSESF